MLLKEKKYSAACCSKLFFVQHAARNYGFKQQDAKNLSSMLLKSLSTTRKFEQHAQKFE